MGRPDDNSALESDALALLSELFDGLPGPCAILRTRSDKLDRAMKDGDEHELKLALVFVPRQRARVAAIALEMEHRIAAYLKDQSPAPSTNDDLPRVKDEPFE